MILSVLYLGRLDYATGLALQKTLVELRHQQRIGIGESDHLAGNDPARAGLDQHSGTDRHGMDGARDLHPSSFSRRGKDAEISFVAFQNGVSARSLAT